MYPSKYISTVTTVGLFLLFLLLRLPGLTSLPISSEEATFIHFSQIINSELHELFIPQTDGRQPLFSWLVLLPLQFFEDPLTAGRIVSITAGLASTIGLFIVGCQLWTFSVGLVASLTYLFCPYSFFFDRLALPESLTTALGIWLFWWTLQLNGDKTNLEKSFLISGILFGLALLTQASALFLGVIPLSLFFLWKTFKKPGFWKLLRLSGLLVIAMVLTNLLLGPDAISGRAIFFHDPSLYLEPGTLFLFPFDIWFHNLLIVRDLYLGFLLLPFIIILIVGLFYLLTIKDKREIVLWIWGFLPPLVITLFSQKISSSSFVLFIPPLILIGSLNINRLVHTILQKFGHWFSIFKPSSLVPKGMAYSLFLVPIFLNGGIYEMTLIRNPIESPLPQLDREQYIEGPTSGYGIREAADFLKSISKNFKVGPGHEFPIILPMNSGNPQEGITVYLNNETTIRQIPAFWWPKNVNLIPKEVRFSLRPSIYQYFSAMRRETHLLDHAVFIFPMGRYNLEKFKKYNPEFEEIWQKIKPNNRSSVILFQKKN